MDTCTLPSLLCLTAAGTFVRLGRSRAAYFEQAVCGCYFLCSRKSFVFFFQVLPPNPCRVHMIEIYHRQAVSKSFIHNLLPHPNSASRIMSGVEVLGVISSIIQVVDATVKLYRAAKDISALPSSFKDAASRLPLVQHTIARIQESLVENELPRHAQEAVKTALEACMLKARKLEAIFRLVAMPPGASRLDRYRRALRVLPKADRVDGLMNGILADLQLLTGNSALQWAAMPRPMAIPLKELHRGRTVVKQHGNDACMSFSNTGSGHQVVSTSDGNQNINLGSGPQMNGVFGGTLYL